MKEYRLGIVGAGNMATAILAGILAKQLLPPTSITMSNRHMEKLEEPRRKGVCVTKDNAEVVRSSDVIVLAVKPQMMDEVVEDIAAYTAGKCIVSIAAGVSTDYFKKRLAPCDVIRVMPNTPLLLGMGATAIAEAVAVPKDRFNTVCAIFAAAGEVAVIREDQMNAIVPVNGSSPAFFFRMADAMVKAAVARGIDGETALCLTARTMEGAANMLLSSGKTAEELTKQVCSPGGTTLAALTAFEEYKFDEMIEAATERCARRAEELGR